MAGGWEAAWRPSLSFRRNWPASSRRRPAGPESAAPSVPTAAIAHALHHAPVPRPVPQHSPPSHPSHTPTTRCALFTSRATRMGDNFRAARSSWPFRSSVGDPCWLSGRRD